MLVVQTLLVARDVLRAILAHSVLVAQTLLRTTLAHDMLVAHDVLSGKSYMCRKLRTLVPKSGT